jgi:hypothetical protein
LVKYLQLPNPTSLFPKGARVGLEVVREKRKIIVAVQLIIPAAEEEEEILMAGQVAKRRQLELEQAKMAPVQVHRRDVLRLVDEII